MKKDSVIKELTGSEKERADKIIEGFVKGEEFVDSIVERIQRKQLKS